MPFRCFHLFRIPFRPLEDHVEIQSEEPAIVAEELAHLWIGGVAAHVQWIEMIGQVETADLEPERVFGADLEVA